MKKIVLTSEIVAIFIFKAGISLAQNKIADSAQNIKFSYAYISIEGKLFSKKLKVQVDFGDTPAQINKGIEYSENLTDKKSYAATMQG
jgi:hypothetical protein